MVDQRPESDETPSPNMPPTPAEPGGHQGPANGGVPAEELVPEDDTVIGTALRWSAAVVGLIVVAAAVIYLLNRPEEVVEVVQEKDAGAIADLARPEVELPDIPFQDVTIESGIDFVHENGARGGKFLPETMGGGCAFLDHDGDGDQDLLLVNSCAWPEHVIEGEPPTPRLYLNDGLGRFTRAPDDAGLTDSFFGMGAAAADYDGDGDQDLYLTAVGSNRLYRNDDGRFTDVTASAGVAGGADDWSTSAGFFDADGDRDLDLFVCNYVRWSQDIDRQLAFSLNGRDRAYGPPTNYTGTQPTLFRNEGDGTFTDVTEEAGLEVLNAATGGPVGKALGVTFADVDRDGRLDILVANDTVQNFLYHNLGAGRFEEVGDTCGIGYDSSGRATGAMGIDSACYRNDDALGVGIGNFANEMTSLYVAEQPGLDFRDDAIGEGIGSPSRLALSFGLFFFDADLDGRLDMLQTNGHLDENISEVQSSQSYRQPAQIFWNAGPEQLRCFTDLDADRIGDLARPIVGRGAAYADVDGDGDLDVLITQVGERPVLLRNDVANGNRWLRFRLVGRAPNRDAIGAAIELTTASGDALRRTVMPTRSYLSQVELPVTFGLGKEEAVKTIRVVWPGGEVQEVTPPGGVDREIVIEQSASPSGR